MIRFVCLTLSALLFLNIHAAAAAGAAKRGSSPAAQNQSDYTQDPNFQDGVRNFQQGLYDSAIESFQRVLKSTPHLPLVYNWLGLTYLRQKESIPSAIGSFEEAIRLDPNFTDAYFNLASTYAGEGNDPAMAAHYFQKTLELDPKYSKAYFGMAWFTLTEKKDPKKAEGLFLKTIELFPDFAEAYYGLGLAYIQLGKGALALGPVSTLRDMNRPDLSALLERALRGDTVFEEAEKAVPESQKSAGAEPASGQAVTEPPASPSPSADTSKMAEEISNSGQVDWS